MKPNPPVLTRADVEALPIPLAATAVLHFLLERPARVYERQEIADALGAKASEVETEIVRMQRRWPILLDRNGPDGAACRGRHGYIAADSPLRKAWANTSKWMEGKAIDLPFAGSDPNVITTVRVTAVEPAPPVGEMFIATAPPIGRGTIDADVAPPDTHVDFAPSPSSSVGVLDEPDDKPRSRKKKDKE